MKSRGIKLAEAVQLKMPHTRVFWAQPHPHPIDEFFDMRGYTLVAVSRTDPNKKVEMLYKDGLGDHPIETLANDFVIHLGPEFSNEKRDGHK